jgi:hypothetical protein
MKARVWHSGLNFECENLPRPEVELGRIVVQVEATVI